jgi:UDP-N-acetylglucosamine 2-epimerase (non-hydrolysing)
MKKVLVCVGTRPNLIKITQLGRCFSKYPLEYKLLHTGQHYDYNMNDIFFQQLGINPPDVFLNINQGSQIEVVSQIMQKFEAFILDYKPDLVMVPGDVNSSFACAFVASRHNIPVAHIESGLRSFDKTMPEEVNRILIDDVTELFFVTEPSGKENLLEENKNAAAIRYVGNTMIDSLVAFMPLIDKSEVRKNLNVENYYLVTFHRPANVDTYENLKVVAEILTELSQQQKIVFPIHPRTKKRFHEFGFEKVIDNPNIIITEPLGYLDFISLAKNARAVITDSGGVQEETTFLGVPCITLRKSTERPVTVTEGTNTMCELEVDSILKILSSINNGTYKKGAIPQFWDGKTSERIAKEVYDFLMTINPSTKTE